MPCSQNVAFEGIAPSDAEFAHPPGLSIIRMLTTGLRNAGWSVSDFENWRDCGWSLECNRQEATLLVALAQTEGQKWMLQISPLRVPGPLGRLFGGKRSAAPRDVFELARAVHALLAHETTFSQMRWRWDGYPDEARSTLEPAEPESQTSS